jgi:hypothetical protein
MEVQGGGEAQGVANQKKGIRGRFHLPGQVVRLTDHESVQVEVKAARWQHHQRVQAKGQAPRHRDNENANLRKCKKKFR